MPGIIIKSVLNTTAMRQLALKLYYLGDTQAMQDVGAMTADYFNQFVPMRTGRLRNSVRYRPSFRRVYVSWGNTAKTAQYAHYQYEGEVYKVNFPVFSKQGDFKGWRSKTGATKIPTGREMGIQRDVAIKHGKTYFLTKLGYRTPGTHHHWLEVGKADPKYNKFRRDVTKYMKDKLKEDLGL